MDGMDGMDGMEGMEGMEGMDGMDGMPAPSPYRFAPALIASWRFLMAS